MAWYEYPTNFSNGTSVNSLGTWVQYMNYASDGWMATGFLFLIFMISFIIGLATSSRKALLASSFIAFVFSVYFMRLDIINPVIPFVFIVLMIAGAIGSKEENSY